MLESITTGHIALVVFSLFVAALVGRAIKRRKPTREADGRRGGKDRLS